MRRSSSPRNRLFGILAILAVSLTLFFFYGYHATPTGLPTGLGICGNGVITPPEQCDNGALNGVVCSPPYGGTCQYCSLSCTLITLTGPYCGDNVINGPEQCDGTASYPDTCVTLGFVGGTLACYSPASPTHCTFDTSACTSPITLGVLTPGSALISAPVTLSLSGTGFQNGDDVVFTGASSGIVTIFDPALTGGHFDFALSVAQLGTLGGGTATVRVQRGSIFSTNTLNFSVLEPLTLSGVTPNTVGMEMTPVVTLSGTGFTTSDQVDIDGQLLSGTAVQVVDTHTINVTIPNATLGTLLTGIHPVRVVQGSGVSNSKNLTIWPVITGSNPSYAINDGITDTPIDVSANGIQSGDTLRITVGANTVPLPAVLSGSSLHATLTAPQKTALGNGNGSVQIERASTYLSKGYVFDILPQGAPTLLSMLPLSGEYNTPATSIQLTGTNFNSGTQVHVGTLTVAPTSVVGTNALSFSLTALQTQGLGVGIHDVWVVVNGTPSNRLPFTIADPLPQNISIAPGVVNIPSLLTAAPIPFTISGTKIEDYSTLAFYPGAPPASPLSPATMTISPDPANQITGMLSNAELQQLGYGTHTLVVTNGLQSSTPITFTMNASGAAICGNGIVEYPPEVCDPPLVQIPCVTTSGLPGVENCASDCASTSACVSSYTPNAAAGDTFVLRDVHFLLSSLDATQNRLAQITVEDNRTPPGIVTLLIDIYDEKGTKVFTLPSLNVDASTGTGQVTVDVDPTHILETGKTYQLYTRIQPDPAENVRGNNSSTVAFVAVQPATSTPVPDVPGWMSLLVLGCVLGFLFSHGKPKKH